jgi:hypothetical protein
LLNDDASGGVGGCAASTPSSRTIACEEGLGERAEGEDGLGGEPRGRGRGPCGTSLPEADEARSRGRGEGHREGEEIADVERGEDGGQGERDPRRPVGDEVSVKY